MLVYKGSSWEKDVVVGDKVKVSGETSSYGLAKQFGKEATYEKVETVTVEYGTAKELTVAEMESYASAETIKPEYVKIIQDDKEVKIDNIIIGIYNKSLTKKGEYRALASLEMLG